MQQNLFSDNNGSPGEKDRLPVQINKGRTVISKEQQSFNRLTARIKSLQEKIKKDSELLNILNTYYHNKVTPEVIRLGEEKIKLSHLLHEKRKAEKFSVLLNSKLDELIFQLLDDAFSVIEPDEKTKELFGRYNGASYEEEMDAQRDDMAGLFSSMLFEQMGIKIDPEDLKKDRPDFDKLEESIKGQFNNRAQKIRKKTKKQLEKKKLKNKKKK